MRALAFILLLLVTTTPALSEAPALKGRVSDYARILSDKQIGALDAQILDFEMKSKRGAQIAVLTVASLEGESIDKVRNEVFRAWRLGAADQHNGVLIVLAPVERRIGIEIGYGLEAILPDGKVDRIINERMKPLLRRGSENWQLAITQAVEEIGATIVKAESAPAPARHEPGTMWLVFAGGFILVAIGAIIGLPVLRPGRAAPRSRDWDTAFAAEQERVRRDIQQRRRDLDGRPPQLNPRVRPERQTSRTIAAAAAAGAATSAASLRRPSDPPAKPHRTERESGGPSWFSSPSSSASSSSSSSSDSSPSYSGGGGDSGGGGASSDF